MCRPKSQGGRRCPSHSDPNRRLERNALARKNYHERKIKKELESSSSESNTLQAQSAFNNHQNTDVFLKNVKEINNSKNLFTRSETTRIHKKLNIISNSNNGKLVENKYFSKETIAGTLNYNSLNENSYLDFGFEEVGDKYFGSRYQTAVKTDLVELSKKELTEVSLKEQAALRFFTSGSFKWFNKAIYTKGANLDSTLEQDKDFDPLASVTNPKEYIPILDKDKTFETVKTVAKYLDTAVEKGPKVQRILYRGVSSKSSTFKGYENSSAWIDANSSIGQEVEWEGYQSTSYESLTAANFSNMGQLKSPGIIYEILTSEGVNVSDLSHFSEEAEVVIPRKSRYVVVGVHKNIETGHFGRKSHVVQMVAINSKGEILDGSNSDSKELEL